MVLLLFFLFTKLWPRCKILAQAGTLTQAKRGLFTRVCSSLCELRARALVNVHIHTHTRRLAVPFFSVTHAISIIHTPSHKPFPYRRHAIYCLSVPLLHTHTLRNNALTHTHCATMHSHTHVCGRTRTHTHAHAHTHACMRIYPNARANACTHTHKPSTHDIHSAYPWHIDDLLSSQKRVAGRKVLISTC